MHGLGGNHHGYYGCVATGLGFGVTLDCGYVLLVIWSGGWSHPGDCGCVTLVQCLQRGVSLDTGIVTPGPGLRGFTLDIVDM